jgi:hypothetical protein
MYIQKGGVKFTVVNEGGKEAMVPARPREANSEVVRILLPTGT